MAHEFKAGDLAIIVSRKAGEVNVGRVVSLVESLGRPYQYEWRGRTFTNVKSDTIWMIRPEGEPLVTGRGEEVAGTVPICEYKLMPIRGEFEPEEQKSKEFEPCA